MRCFLIAATSMLLMGGQIALAQTDNPAAIVSREFIYEKAPFPECHASTLAETPQGLVTAWFGGTREKNPDVGIWVSLHRGNTWSAPIEVANGVQPDGSRHPSWNPVLYQVPKGDLLLFYKVGPDPVNWWGMLKRSADGGKTWSKEERLPDGILGPIKNKPVLLASGTLLCPTSTEHDGWKLHFEMTKDLGKTWHKTTAVEDKNAFGAIQPSVLFHKDGKLQAICRSKTGKVVETWSSDGGETWSPVAQTPLPNPNSGTDAVTLKDGRHVLIYNHVEKTPGKWGGPRSPLNVAFSNDGKTWQPVVILESESGEYSYPAVIQTADGLVHITYTWKRQKVKHVVLDPKKIARI